MRETRLAPRAFVETALRELPNEHDEQIAAGILGRLRRAVEVYLATSDRAAMLPDAERLLLNGAADGRRPYGIRKSQLDAFIDLAGTPAAVATLDAWLDSTTAAGLPLRQPSRWSIVTRLVSLAASTADRRLADEERRDTTAGGKRRAFIAGAARPDPATKRAYFNRYFADSTLNEEWVTASLRAFNDPEQNALTLPYLAAALDTLPWIQRNRRIFFLGSWLGAFIGGQRDAAALRIIDDYVARHPAPVDLRQKVLQSRDDLERIVRIRRGTDRPNDRRLVNARDVSSPRRTVPRAPVPRRRRHALRALARPVIRCRRAGRSRPPAADHAGRRGQRG